MSQAGLFGTVLLVGLVAYACGGPDEPETSSAAATAPGVVAPAQVTVPAAPSPPALPLTTSPAWTAPASPDTGYGVGPEVVTVTSVTDGDTFRVGDRRIRVIGIDSCEAGTTGGTAATAAARAILSGATLTLTSEPGVDRDRYGREVRYVATSSGDLGRLMVPAGHTGVYEGGNTASAAYLDALRNLDGERSCGSPVAAPAPTRSPSAASAPAAGAPSTTAPRPLVRQPSPSGGAFTNCAAARAAGAAPLYRGQPGYQAKLDRDGDGVACEGG